MLTTDRIKTVGEDVVKRLADKRLLRGAPTKAQIAKAVTEALEELAKNIREIDCLCGWTCERHRQEKADCGTSHPDRPCPNDAH